MTLLTAREVAALLSVSTETVLRWTRCGRLPGFRLPGGALRYREADLEGWLRDRATPTPPRVTEPGDHSRMSSQLTPPIQTDGEMV